MKRELLSVALVLFSAGIATGIERPTLMYGHDLRALCQSEAGVERCIGFVAGSYEAYSKAIPVYFCPPDGVSAEILRDAVVKYLDASPERLEFPATHLVSEALMTEWGCY